MLKPNPPGRPTDLTEEIIDSLCALVPNNHSISQVARLSMLPIPTVQSWYDRGRADSLKGLSNIFTQFSLKFDYARGLEVNSLLTDIRKIDSFPALAWTAEKCYTEEYGSEAPIIREIRQYHEEHFGDKKNAKQDPNEIG